MFALYSADPISLHSRVSCNVAKGISMGVRHPNFITAYVWASPRFPEHIHDFISSSQPPGRKERQGASPSPERRLRLEESVSGDSSGIRMPGQGPHTVEPWEECWAWSQKSSACLVGGFKQVL